MALTPEQLKRLVGAIASDSLVVLCGAGLSMPEPSRLPSAKRISQIAYDKWSVYETLDICLRDDIEALAAHFYQRNQLSSVFVKKLVPWDDLVGRPNRGHAAVADTLLCRWIKGAVSTNFDDLIERWAEVNRVLFRPALTGEEAEECTDRSPLVKIHGCMKRDIENTVWTDRQLTDAPVADRIASCSQWLNLILPDKHLLVVGFWTDWAYLNDVLAQAFNKKGAASVTVVDLETSSTLQQKAPALWNALTSLSGAFEHIAMSGEDALESLREAYSRAWAREYYRYGQQLLEDAGLSGAPSTPFDQLSMDELYDLRRDVEGIPYSRAATLKAPRSDAAAAAFAMGALLSAGATRLGSLHDLNGVKIRVVNGAGRAIGEVRRTFDEPPSAVEADIVVCAGAVDLGVPEALIDRGRGDDVVRPSEGGASRWLTLEKANMELSLWQI